MRVEQVDRIREGVYSLNRLVSDPRWGLSDPNVLKEVEDRRPVTGNATAARVVKFVWEDVLRMVDRAFAEHDKFPSGHYTFPTALGDLISALDDCGQDRYQIDTTTMWDRVWWILPKDAKADVSDARLG